MTEHLDLIWKKIEHLRRMRTYLAYSLEQTLPLIPVASWELLYTTT